MKAAFFFLLAAKMAVAGFFYQPPAGFHQNQKSLQLTAGAVDCGHEAALEFEYNQKWAVSVWFKSSTGAFTNCNLVAQMENDASSFQGWRMRIASTTLTVQMTHDFTGGEHNTVTATLTGATDRAWHHLAVNFPDTQDASDIEIYYDGSLLSPTVTSNTLGTNTIVNAGAKFSIGSMDASTQFCSDNDVNVDDVQIYGNYAFTSTDVATLYRGGDGAVRLGQTLTSWFNFENDTTASVTDSAGGATACIHSSGADRDFERDTPTNPFDPRQITGIYAWFDATDLNGNGDGNSGYSDADDVDGWVDKKSGLVTQNSLTYDLPIVKNSIKNSLPVVRFDGTDDCIEIEDNDNLSVPASGFSVITVADSQNLSGTSDDGNALWAKDSDALDPGACDPPSDCQREYGLLNSGSGEINWYVKCDLESEPDPQVRRILGSISTGWHIFSNLFDGGTSHTNLLWYKNLSTAGTVSADTLGTCSSTQINGTMDFQIGCRDRSQASGNSHMDMDLGELLIYRTYLSEYDVIQINEYFNNKWAIY